MIAKKGDWVRIHNVILEPAERASHLPDDTKSCQLEMWVKGFLVNEQASIGENVTIKTYIGREISGNLEQIDPSYTHTFGEHVKELSYIGTQLRLILGGNEDE